MRRLLSTSAVLRNVVKAAQDGFGSNAAAYDAHRPGYTQKVVEEILEEIGTPQTSMSGDASKYDVLELGSGTGKFTELLVPKLPSGCRYMATEPSQNFFDLLKAKSLPIDTAMAPASSIPLPDNSVQNVLCAQCLHWFSTEESLKEIHRVLVPGGKLIPVWNVNKYEEDKWTIEVYKQRFVVMEKTGSSPKYWVNSMEWKKAFDESDLFVCDKQKSLPGIEYRCDLDKILNNLRTISSYIALPSDECQAHLDHLREAILSYSDVNSTSMNVPYTSELFVFKAVLATGSILQ